MEWKNLVVLGRLKTQHKPHDASYIHKQMDKCEIQFAYVYSPRQAVYCSQLLTQMGAVATVSNVNFHHIILP
jgi:hypothetical protein